MYRNNCRAFTLIEMLVVVVMFSLIALAIASTLTNGIKIWQRLNQSGSQEDVNIFFERIAWELRNSFEFNTIKFQGARDRVSFAALVTTSGSILAQETGIGQVTYSYDRSNKRLNKEVRNYSQIYKGDNGYRQRVLEEIGSLEFSYYYYDEKAMDYIWLEEWQQQTFPLAVRIELEFDNGRQSESFIRTIDIPVS